MIHSMVRSPLFAANRPDLRQIQQDIKDGEWPHALYQLGEQGHEDRFDALAQQMLDSGNPYFQAEARREIEAHGRQDQFRKPHRV